MRNTRAITTALLLLLACAGVHAQEVRKVKRSDTYHCDEPKVTVKEKEGQLMVKRKSYGGYSKVKMLYHYDSELEQYYYISGGHRIYYDSGWRPF
jgi:hypothetical protein